MSSLLRKFHSKAKNSSSSNSALHQKKTNIKSSLHRRARNEDTTSLGKCCLSIGDETSVQEKMNHSDKYNRKLYDTLDIIFALLRQYHLSVSKDKVPILSKLITEYLSLQDQAQFVCDFKNASSTNLKERIHSRNNISFTITPDKDIQRFDKHCNKELSKDNIDTSSFYHTDKSNQCVEQSIEKLSDNTDSDKITALLTITENIHYLSRWIKDCLMICPDQKQNFPLLGKLFKFLRSLLWAKINRKRLLDCGFNTVIMQVFSVPECMVDVSLLKDVYHILLHLCYDLEHIIAFTTLNFELGRKKENFIKTVMNYLVGITDSELQYIILGTLQSICAKKEGRIALLTQSTMIESEKNDTDIQSSVEASVPTVNSDSISAPSKNCTLINKDIYILSTFLEESYSTKIRRRALSVIHNLSADEKTIFTLRKSKVISTIMDILWYHHGKHMALSSSLLQEERCGITLASNSLKGEILSSSCSQDKADDFSMSTIRNNAKNSLQKKEFFVETESKLIGNNNNIHLQPELNYLDKNRDSTPTQTMHFRSTKDIQKCEEEEQINAALGIIQNMSREKTSCSIFLEQYDAIKPLTVFLSSSKVSYQTSAAGAIYNLLSHDDMSKNSEEDSPVENYPIATDANLTPADEEKISDKNSTLTESCKEQVKSLEKLQIEEKDKVDHVLLNKRTDQSKEKTNLNQRKPLQEKQRKDLLESSLSDLILLGVVADVLTFQS